MSKVIVLSRRKLWASAAVLFLLTSGALYFWYRSQIAAVSGPAGGTRVIHMVTGEFKSTTTDGKTIESYRWDPGTVFAEKGETIKLVIYGVNGDSHPFFIEGTDIRGEVKQGKETVVIFPASKEGVYRLICLTHPDADHHGPMIAYIVVD